MFLHIGDSKVIFMEDLVGIFNLKIKEKAENKQFLEFAAGENKKAGKGSSKRLATENWVEKNIPDDSKSFVVTTSQVYYSPISSNTLSKRNNIQIDND